MARIKRTGLNYFPLDCNFFGDKKIVNLNQKFGPAGPMALLDIYSEIYRNEGYYIVFDLDMLDYLCYQTRLSEDEVFELLNHLNSRSILTIISLENEPQKELNLQSLPLLITGVAIQKQYQESIKTMNKTQPVDPVIWLLNEDETLACMEFSASSKFPNLTPLNPDNLKFCTWINESTLAENNFELLGITNNNSRVIDSNSELKEITPEESGNPLYIKEKKRKENKRNKNKINNIDSPKGESEVGVSEDTPAPKKAKKNQRKKKNNYVEVSDINNKMVLGQFENVYLKGSELDKLKLNYPNHWEGIIETLSSYKESSGKGYKSDYAAMCNWVINRVVGEKSRAAPKKNNNSDDFLMQIARGEVNLEGS